MQTQVENISGVEIFSLPAFSDERGFFKEVVRIDNIKKTLGEDFVIKQVNHSRSNKNTLRGIHVAPWNKLIYVVAGKVQAVIVDFRKNSDTFGKYISVVLGEENKSCIFIPKYLGNSYLVLSESADYVYLTDQEWAPNKEKGVAWNDPSININWMIKSTPLLSEKDKNNPLGNSLF